MGPYEDQFTTVAAGPGVQLKVMGSRFLGQVLAAGSREQALALIEPVRREHHKATHHCWALRAAPPEHPREICEDDGEPGGTAGAPMLAALAAADVFDAVVVVTRWFGGTKLGRGGLVRAYGDAARLALEQAPRLVRWRDVSLQVSCSWDDLGAVEAVLARHAACIPDVQRHFEDEPVFRLHVRRSRSSVLRDAVVEVTGGRARLEVSS